MDYPGIFWWTVVWMVFWGTVGGIVTRRVYLRRDLDTSRAVLGGALVGAASGPVGLVPLWLRAPAISFRLVLGSTLLAIFVFVAAFALADPDNNCVANGDFVASQITNGLIIGIIYGLMAMGLTLIFSILGIVSFAHGEFYMIGGMLVYFLTNVIFPGLHPIFSVFAACAICFCFGALFERLFLTPMYSGKVDRPVEYGILITFGLAFTLQYFVQAIAGASPVKVQRFFSFPQLRVPSQDDPWLIRSSAGNMELFGTVSISNPRFVAAVISVLVLCGLMLFLYRTWAGKALRAVSQDRDAATIAGINPHRMNMIAFALGCMIASLSGATLVQAFSWLPQVGQIPAVRSFVIVVLGGLGSLPGAFIGGIIIGLVEAAGTGCIPSPQRAASYIPAYGVVVLVLVLLLKPTGLLGRKYASGAHGKF